MSRLLLILFAFGLLARPVMAVEGELLGTKMVVEVAEGAANTQVTLRHEVRLESATDEVPLIGMRFRGARFLDVRATIGDASVPVQLDASKAPLVVGVLSIPSGRRQDRRLTIMLRYELASSVAPSEDRFDITLPLLLVDMAPLTAPDTLFQAELQVPRDFQITGSFPTVPMETIPADRATRYRLSFQVVPSMVRLRGGIGETSFFTFTRSVDLVVLAIILLLSFWGWRGLRRKEDKKNEAPPLSGR